MEHKHTNLLVFWSHLAPISPGFWVWWHRTLHDEVLTPMHHDVSATSPSYPATNDLLRKQTSTGKWEKTNIHHHNPWKEGSVLASFHSTLLINKNHLEKNHVPSKWLECRFPAMASLKTSCFCQSEVLQPRNVNNILPIQINPQPIMNTLGSHPSRDGVTVYQVLEAACRYRNVHAPEKQRGSPKNHPIEIRKIIWTKPPCLGSMLIFQGVSGALYLI